mgnify:CR=1 FL=1
MRIQVETSAGMPITRQIAAQIRAGCASGVLRPGDRLPSVRALAANGVADGLGLKEFYDPSLPPVSGDEDQLIQIFLNLVKNASEAVAARVAGDPEPRGRIVAELMVDAEGAAVIVVVSVLTPRPAAETMAMLDAVRSGRLR